MAPALLKRAFGCREIQFFCLAVACAFWLTSGSAEAADERAGTKTLRVAVTLPNHIEQFDPNRTFLSTYDIVLLPLFDKLMMPDWYGRPIMRAARSASVAPDGKSINVTLRDDVFWNDGTRVVAGDYVRGLQRAAIADSSTKHLMSGVLNSDRWSAGDYSVPLGVEAPDDETMIVRLTRPFAYDLTNLMNIQANPYPAAPPADGAFIATNGPYMLEEMKQDIITVVRNPQYRGEQPYFDRIEYIGFSHDVAIDQFISRKADVLLGPLGKQKKWLLDRFKGYVIEVGLPRKYFIAFATPTAATPRAILDANLRRALYFALDHEAFEKTNIFISDRSRCGFIPAPLPCSDERKKLWRIGQSMDDRVREAREAVERAGYSRANPLKLTLVVATSIQGYNELASFVKSSWYGLGVDVELVEVKKFTEAIDAMKTGKYEMLLGSFYQMAPHQYIYVPEGIGDLSFRYSARSSRFDDFSFQLARAADPEYSSVIFDAEKFILDEMTMLPLVSDSQVAIYADWLAPNQTNVAKLNLRYFTPK